MRWFLRWGVWGVLAVLVFLWEVGAVKGVRKTLGMPPREHVTISEMVWRLQRRFPRVGPVVVVLVMVDLTLHFLFQTPLLPLP